MKSIFHRVSVRKFKEEPVKSVDAEWMMRAAMAAPSACNQQPWEFYIVRDKEKIEALSKCSPYSGCAAGAPMVIVPCYRTEGLVAPQFQQIDLAIACENILLQADSLGYGAVWLAVAPEEERMNAVAEVLQIPETLKPFCLIPVGVPAESHEQINRFDPSRIHEI
ncbi:MAG: nitroreductase family protein [Solobacterium sp.]|nr:nitroreductase family protein [Solobacterium sp.]